MKFKFIQIENKYWILEIDSVEKLLHYHDNHYSNGMAEGVNNILNNKHATTDDGKKVEIARYIHSEDNLIVAIEKMSNKALKAKAKYVLEGKTIYINPRGGWNSGTHKEEDITKVEERECIIFPNNDEVRYLQWRDGGHYYVKVDKFDIVVNGKQKWDTKQEAKEAYEIWKSR